MRFALAGFVHETVTFLPSPTTRADFETIALRGQDLLDGHRGGNTVFGGFIAACDNADVDLIGLVASDHAPSGPVEQDAFDAFTRENMQELVLQVWQRTKKTVFFITHSVEEALFMATRLIVMSPRPGRITHEYRLDFYQRYFEQGDARKIKSDPDFIKIREEVLSIIYGEEIEE